MTKLKRIHRGDDGYTDLGEARVWKGSAAIELLGTIDELVASIGLAKCFLPTNLAELATEIQSQLMSICAAIATGRYENVKQLASRIEEETKRLWETNKLSFHFVKPGPPPGAAALHLARTICRRAERWAWRAAAEGAIPRDVAIALNRVSDLLYTMSLVVEKEGRE